MQNWRDSSIVGEKQERSEDRRKAEALLHDARLEDSLALAVLHT